ncbi:efflux RND transporter periplasmic adaptor subunit [Sphingomonas solaris]|uniref:Efflux RND transporter periplasmic adaptor subunit n=1 Tax=Alterirhizorhabdus solaris TaxID=2529389 RepID=A0A558QY22_9SPHN|nr:efflux RND transporter periplasmic adaptor subunit [Sphingomonas solaris]TVV72066.1 efflux RND transporter periplasmic adaptor subunit [Sphingomonas solaris]
MNIEKRFSTDRATPAPENGGRGRVAGLVARPRLWMIAAIVVILAVAAFAYARGGKAPAPVASPPPRVTVTVPGRQAVAGSITTTGTLAARREMPVGIAGEGGMISRVLVEPGDWVAAGQVLATIERSVQVQEGASLAASINVARADAALAQSELDRAKALVARGFISKADIDRRTATRDAANARVKVAQAQYGQAGARIGRLDIRAPAAGLVLTRAVEPGQVVGPGSGTLFRIAKGGEMELAARLAEQDLARLRIGLPAQVTPVGTATPFRGTIWQLSPIIDPQTRQGVARIALTYDPALRPGGFAAATIASGSVDAPLLPESAVLSDAAGNYVFVVGPGNAVRRQAVKVGDVSDAGITIVSGLTGTEQVVLAAGAFLNPGDKVTPVRAPVQRPAA